MEGLTPQPHPKCLLVIRVIECHRRFSLEHRPPESARLQWVKNTEHGEEQVPIEGQRRWASFIGSSKFFVRGALDPIDYL